MAPDDDHNCGWKAYAKAQDAKLAEVSAKLVELERRFLAKKSERRKTTKLPPPLPIVADPKETKAKRAKLATLRESAVRTEHETVRVPDENRACPACASTDLRAVGEGKSSTVYVSTSTCSRTFGSA